MYDHSLADPLDGCTTLDSNGLVRVPSGVNPRQDIVEDVRDVDPNFAVPFDPVRDKDEIDSDLQFEANVPLHIRNRMTELIKEFWCIFRKAGVLVPIRKYKMVIDTGNNEPFKCRNPLYGTHETRIIEEQIQALLNNGCIVPDTESPFMSKIVLAPKRHQYGVTDVDDIIWRFCINYVGLKKITKVMAYPIPRCDCATMDGFGNAVCFVLLDAFSGYH